MITKFSTLANHALVNVTHLTSSVDHVRRQQQKGQGTFWKQRDQHFHHFLWGLKV